jgi:PAS domain S-box-containing protein
MTGSVPRADSADAAAVVARERRQHALLLHMSDLLVVTTADGTLTDASPSATRILGYPDGSRLGTDVLDLVHPDDRTAGAEALRHIAAHPGPSAPRRLRLVAADGSSRRYEIRASTCSTTPTSPASSWSPATSPRRTGSSVPSGGRPGCSS